MSRVVVKLDQHEDGSHTYELAAGGPTTMGQGPVEWVLPADDADDMVAGTALVEHLTHPAGHPDVAGALAAAWNAAAGAAPRPILFHLNSLALDACKWEALCRSGVFLAQNPLWPVGRVAGELPSGEPIRHTLDGAVRVLAVLAAAGVDAAPQWRALRDALAGRDTQLTVLTSQPELVAEVNAFVPPAVSRLTARAELLNRRPGETTEMPVLKAAFDAVRPNVLHVFAHGTPGDGVAAPALLFETAAGRAAGLPAGDPGGTLVVEQNDLLGLPGVNGLWLAVLNGCHTADGRAVPALARRLVHAVRLPAVVGMRDRVSPTEAHAFCGLFYPAALALLDPARGGAETAVEWVRALTAVWQQLKKNGDRWTVPVVYVRADPVLVRPAPATTPARPAAFLEAMLDMLKTYRRTNAANMTPDALAALDDEIRRVGRELYA